MMPTSILDAPGILPGELTPEQERESAAALAALYTRLGIDPSWVIGEPDHDRDGAPVLMVSWIRMNDVLEAHGDNAEAVVTAFWSRRCICLEVAVSGWRPCLPGEFADRVLTPNGSERRILLARLVSFSPPGWDGHLTWDGGLHIGRGT